MFAPEIAKPQTKATEDSKTRLVPHRSMVVGDRLGRDPLDQVRFLQRTIGNRATLRLLAPSSTLAETPRPGVMQAKLVVGHVNDPLEHEADRVAGQVMRMQSAGLSIGRAGRRLTRKCSACEEEARVMRTKSAAPAAGTLRAMTDNVSTEPSMQTYNLISITSAPRGVRRECDACDDDEVSTGCDACYNDTETVPVQPKLARHVGASGGEAPGIVDDVLRSPGRALDTGTRSFFEQRFGYDFGRVRVHTDSTAGQSAAAIGAHAYTSGSDIVFANGRFDPNSQAGRELLAHELTHVVQQGGQPKIISRDDGGTTPAQQPSTPSDGVRSLANRFETYATQGEAALARAPIDARDANRIRSNIAKLRTAIAGMRTVADNGDDNISVALLGSFTSARLAKAAASLHRAAPSAPAVTVAETAPREVATLRPGAAGDTAVEGEAQQISRIIGSIGPTSAPSSGILVMRQAAPEIEQQIEQQAPVIDQLIDVSAIGLGIGAAANDTVAVGAVAAALGSPVVVVAAVVVVALLAVAAVWYFWEQGLSEETKRLEDVPPQTGSPAPAPGVTLRSPPPPVAVRPGEDRWKTTFNPATGDFFSSEAEYNRVPRNANQTCANSRLDKLESEMHRLCDESGKWSCSDAVEKIGKENQRLLDCPELLKRIQIGEACVKAQLDLQAECFANKPDPVHAAKIQAYQAVLNLCKQKLNSRFPGGCP